MFFREQRAAFLSFFERKEEGEKKRRALERKQFLFEEVHVFRNLAINSTLRSIIH